MGPATKGLPKKPSNESSPVIRSDPGEIGHFNVLGQKDLSKEMAKQNSNIFELLFTSFEWMTTSRQERSLWSSREMSRRVQK